jgi:hypothetical protein
MLGRVALIRTDVSEELGASFIRVTRIGELGTTPAYNTFFAKAGYHWQCPNQLKDLIEVIQVQISEQLPGYFYTFPLSKQRPEAKTHKG